MQGISYHRKTTVIMMITAVAPVIAIHAIVSQNLGIVAAFQQLNLQQKAMLASHKIIPYLPSNQQVRQGSHPFPLLRQLPNHHEIIITFDILKIIKSSTCLSNSSDEYTQTSSISEDSIIMSNVRTSNQSPSRPVNQQLYRRLIISGLHIQRHSVYYSYPSEVPFICCILWEERARNEA